MGAAIVAAVAAAQQRIFRAFRDAGATDAANARTLDELGIREDRMFRSMVRRTYIVAAGRGYYLNLRRVEERRRRTIVCCAIALIGSAIALALVAKFA
jgi:hypothetical protein